MQKSFGRLSRRDKGYNMSDKKVFEKEFVGLTVQDENISILTLEKNNYRIDDLLIKAGISPIDFYIAEDYRNHYWTNLSTKKLEQLNNNDIFADSVLEYRASTGNKYPPVYKIKVVLEVQPLTSEETEKFWKQKQEE